MAAYDEVPSSVNYPKDVDRQEIKEIRDILGGFISRKASNDTTIGEDRSSILASLIEQDSTRCTEVGQTLVSIADEIDLGHGGIFQDLMGRVGAPDVAFWTFQSVAGSLFTLNSAGGQVVSITWRKIAALLGFCYSLCRQFLLSTESTDNQVSMKRSLGAFFTAVVGFLARFLFEGRLLNWIRSQGGWMSVLQRPISHVNWTTLTVAGIGLTVVGISLLAFSRFTS